VVKQAVGGVERHTPGVASIRLQREPGDSYTF
jgi:hypothetical protein